MVGLQRSTISFRRQGSSGIVWDNRLIAQLNQQANDQKPNDIQTQDEQATKLIVTTTSEVKDQTVGEGVKPIKTDGGVERTRSNRNHRNTAMDPPSPRLSAFGCCSAFGKKPSVKKVSLRKRPSKRRA